MSALLSSRLQPLRSGGRASRLSFVPQTLTAAEIIQLILIFVFRQILSLVGIGSNTLIISRNGELADLPELHLSMPLRINEDSLRYYANAVGLDDTSSILNDPAQTCALLSAFSEPAMLLLLASRNCPVLPLGAVNVKNWFEILLPRLCAEEALLHMKYTELRARILPETRRARRGVEIDLEVKIVNLDEDAVIFRQIFTMLQFMKFNTPAATSRRDIPKKSAEGDWEQLPLVSFYMDLYAPLSWARICMDYNVLHTSTIAARLFGFSGRIAHGNHALALGLARLRADEERSGLSAGQRWESTALEVHFMKPITLPAKLAVQMSVIGESQNVRISKGDTTCITALLKALTES